GYEFNGWQDDDENRYDGGEKIEITKDITFTASWEIIEYTITYHLNGGTLENPKTKFTINDLPFTLPMPEAQDDNYGFDKWTTDEQGKNVVLDDYLYAEYLKDLTLYAHYAESLELMSFDYADSNHDSLVLSGVSNARCVVIPDTFNGLPVEHIGRKAFFNHTNLTSVTIPNTVYYIKDEAFYGCVSLTSIHIPEILICGDNAFYNCCSLSTVYVDSLDIANRVSHHLFDSAKDVYILDTIEIYEGIYPNPSMEQWDVGQSYDLFTNSFEKQAEPVIVNGQSYNHYVRKNVEEENQN
ncbi:MAG: leucine-rich repeat protein, partial [Bacteroides sp.]|nr:leucine-rich repeat protein [Bacteroides sp.]